VSAHTPGPWRLTEPENIATSISGPDGELVVGGEFDGQMVPFKSLADARLCAAAPDLLQALLRVIAIADRKTDEFDAARAAIAKATGDGKGEA
jgi:hypothetical protein